MIMDGVTTKKYWDMAHGVTNDTSDSIGDEKQISVSIWYFVASLTVWFMTPFLAMWFLPHDFPRLRGRAICNPFKILGAYWYAIGFVYFGIPSGDISFGLRSLFCHESYKNKETEYEEKYNHWHSVFAAMKIFEQFGEAIPQFIIALLFYSNNSGRLYFNEMLIGGLTLTLSFGSIVFGVVNGIMTVPKWIEIERNRREYDQNNP